MKNYKNKEKKVGIITWHYYPNYGSVLQAYALQETIRNLGYNIEVINYRNPKYGVNNEKFNLIKACLTEMQTLLPNQLRSRWNYPFLTFRKKYLNETSPLYDNKELKNIGKKYETIICGSDQIWAPNVYNPIYMLEFATDKTRKVSYAASIGLNDIPEDLVQQYKQLLSRFYKISVREENGRQLLERRCGITSKVVIDPTLLLTATEWKKIEKKVYGISIPFVFCYFLNGNHNYKEKVVQFAGRRHMQIIGISAKEEDKEWLTQYLKNVGPEEFLWLIDHCEYVFTDSYHGTLFSILFHKKFITFERFENTDILCQNSRIKQLSQMFNLQKVITPVKEYDLEEPSEINFKEIDYQLMDYKKKSLEYLIGALN